MIRVDKTNPRNVPGRIKLRKRVAAEGRPCALCGNPIDYSLPATHPYAYELDEIVPISRGGSPVEYANVQPVHRSCNLKKKNKMPYELMPPVTTPTRDW